MASVPGKRVYRTNRKAAEQEEVGVGAQGDRRQTPPAPSGPPTPAAGDGQGGVTARKIQQPAHKFSFGAFQVWLAGPSAWEVRDKRTGQVVAHARNTSDCCCLAQRFYAAEKEATHV